MRVYHTAHEHRDGRRRVSRHGKSVKSVTNDANQRLLDAFGDALWLEDGLARNTLESYCRDVRQFGAWLKAHGGKSLVEAGHADIQGYLDSWSVPGLEIAATATSGVTDDGLLGLLASITDIYGSCETVVS